jgi:hypothetical protein
MPCSSMTTLGWFCGLIGLGRLGRSGFNICPPRKIFDQALFLRAKIDENKYTKHLQTKPQKSDSSNYTFKIKRMGLYVTLNITLQKESVA